MVPAAAESSQWVYATLSLLGMEEARRHFGMAMAQWELQRELEPSALADITVGEAIRAIRQNPGSLEDWRNRALRQRVSLVWGGADDILPMYAEYNRSREPIDGRPHYRWQGDSLWMDEGFINEDQKRSSIDLVLVVTNITSKTVVLRTFDLELAQGPGKPAFKLGCDYHDKTSTRSGLVELPAGQTGFLRCKDGGQNHPNHLRADLATFRAAVRSMRAHPGSLKLTGKPERNDDFPAFDGEKVLVYADAVVRAIEAANCIQRGSCSRALGEAVMKTLP